MEVVEAFSDGTTASAASEVVWAGEATTLALTLDAAVDADLGTCRPNLGRVSSEGDRMRRRKTQTVKVHEEYSSETGKETIVIHSSDEDEWPPPKKQTLQGVKREEAATSSASTRARRPSVVQSPPPERAVVRVLTPNVSEDGKPIEGEVMRVTTSLQQNKTAQYHVHIKFHNHSSAGFTVSPAPSHLDPVPPHPARPIPDLQSLHNPTHRCTQIPPLVPSRSHSQSHMLVHTSPCLRSGAGICGQRILRSFQFLSPMAMGSRDACAHALSPTD